MRSQLTALTSKLSLVILLALAALVPLIFTPLTTEYYETSKLIILIVGSSMLLIVWSLKWIFQGKVSFIRTPLDAPLLLLLLIIILASVFTDSKSITIYGNFPRIHGSLISWITILNGSKNLLTPTVHYAGLGLRPGK